MKLSQVLQIIDGQIISKDIDLEQEIWVGGGADLMSDVLATSQEGMLLMTGLTNPQVVRTAEMAGIVALVFVRGKLPPPETIELAAEKNIPLVACQYTMFETCGRLYQAGLCGSDSLELTRKRWQEVFEKEKKSRQ